MQNSEINSTHSKKGLRSSKELKFSCIASTLMACSIKSKSETKSAFLVVLMYLEASKNKTESLPVRKCNIFY